uniref:Capsid n=1 Tax=Rhinolophus pusillus adeno-associated virus BtAAV-CXC1 TaxID=2599141 RepID=A0A5B8IGP3_9VIRU|nr:capsid [Rhinolophus pusillus adeno-associated virus BtAAV-CXC1]
MSRVVMSFVDHPPDWLKEVAGGLREFLDLEPGAPRPKANQQKQDQRGLVVPGYKYLGPFNGLDKGQPVNKADEVAREHDLEYNKLLEAGDNPYLKYNHADSEFQEKLQDDKSWGGNLGKAVFQAKKRVLEPFGLVEETPAKTAPGKKRPLESPWRSPDSSTGTGKKGDQPSRKRLNFDPPQDGSSEAAPSGGGEGAAPSGNMATDIVATGAGAPMGDAQQGSDGVGNASGDWHCDSQWMGDRVITKSTRTWVLPSYNNHIYKEINSTGNGLNGRQRLLWIQHSLGDILTLTASTATGALETGNDSSTTTGASDPRPCTSKSSTSKSKKSPLKTRPPPSPTTSPPLFTHFAGAEISAAVRPRQRDRRMPAGLPPGGLYASAVRLCNAKQRRYKNHPTERSSFWCLEYFPSKMLRTGNNFEFVYKFEDVPFYCLDFHPARVCGNWPILWWTLICTVSTRRERWERLAAARFFPVIMPSSTKTSFPASTSGLRATTPRLNARIVLTWMPPARPTPCGWTDLSTRPSRCLTVWPTSKAKTATSLRWRILSSSTTNRPIPVVRLSYRFKTSSSPKKTRRLRPILWPLSKTTPWRLTSNPAVKTRSWALTPEPWFPERFGWKETFTYRAPFGPKFPIRAPTSILLRPWEDSDCRNLLPCANQKHPGTFVRDHLLGQPVRAHHAVPRPDRSPWRWSGSCRRRTASAGTRSCSTPTTHQRLPESHSRGLCSRFLGRIPGHQVYRYPLPYPNLCNPNPSIQTSVTLIPQ